MPKSKYKGGDDFAAEGTPNTKSIKKKADNQLYGHMSVPSASVVANPSTKVARKADGFTSKCFHGNLRGKVGKGAKIAGRGL